jgi:hypothetical protein
MNAKIELQIISSTKGGQRDFGKEKKLPTQRSSKGLLSLDQGNGVGRFET